MGGRSIKSTVKKLPQGKPETVGENEKKCFRNLKKYLGPGFTKYFLIKN